MTKKYALITGSSAGIGKEFAKQLAAKGWSLILIARRETKLKELSEQFIKAYNIDCQWLTVDLSDPNANKYIYEFCQTKHLNVSLLINNAGYGVPGDFDTVDWSTHSAMLQVMLNSIVELTHHFYPAMKKAGFGRIIHVSSLAGLTPATAGHTLYGAVKSFLIKFGHSLHLEAKDYGVHVTTLCPGFTYTEFHDVNGTREMVSKLPKGLWMEASEVVRQGLEAVEKNQPIKINGWKNQLIYGLTKLLPDKATRLLLGNNISKFRKR